MHDLSTVALSNDINTIKKSLLVLITERADNQMLSDNIKNIKSTEV